MQYTLRNIPPQLDQALREKAHRERRSLNEVAIEALRRGVGMSDEQVVHNDLDWIAGTWVEDPAFEEIRAMHDRVDPADWPAKDERP